jgi:hypothetical protein
MQCCDGKQVELLGKTTQPGDSMHRNIMKSAMDSSCITPNAELNSAMYRIHLLEKDACISNSES